MAMQIQTNIAALFAQRGLGQIANDTQRVIQRLGSGLRINGARDDAAGLAISERMTAQIRGNSQAVRNVNDGISMLQVADGAMGSLNGMIQRMRELAVQANNSTLSLSDKQALQGEVNQLLQGIDDIAAQTQFNGDKVFSQSISSLGGPANERAVMDGLKLGWLEESEKRIKQFYGIKGDGATLTVDLTFTDGAGNVAASVSGTGGAGGKVYNQKLNIDMADFTPPNLPDGGSAPFYNDRIIAHEMVHAVMGRSVNMTSMPTWFLEGSAELIHGADERLKTDIAINGQAAVVNQIGGAWGSASIDYSSAYAATRYLHDKLKGLGVSGGLKGLMQNLASTGSNLDVALNAVTNGVYASAAAFVTDWQANGSNYITNQMNLNNADTGAIGGLDADMGPEYTAKNIMTDRGSVYGDQVLEGFNLVFPTIATGTDQKQVELHIGASATDKVLTSFAAVNSSALGIKDLDLINLPSFAIVHLDQALDYVNRRRADAGASLARLEFTANQLTTSVENSSASRSRIRDADYAQETAALSRQQILQQSATAMLAQASQLPQLALQLLR
ncbi:MAG: flagellinolysin [Chitinivorax sp.]|jgi:flagellin